MNHRLELLAQCLLALSSRDSEHPLFSCFCSFPFEPHPTTLRVVTALSTIPTANWALVFVLVLVRIFLSVLSLLPFAFALDVLALASAKRTSVHRLISSWM